MLGAAVPQMPPPSAISELAEKELVPVAIPFDGSDIPSVLSWMILQHLKSHRSRYASAFDTDSARCKKLTLLSDEAVERFLVDALFRDVCTRNPSVMTKGQYVPLSTYGTPYGSSSSSCSSRLAASPSCVNDTRALEKDGSLILGSNKIYSKISNARLSDVANSTSTVGRSLVCSSNILLTLAAWLSVSALGLLYRIESDDRGYSRPFGAIESTRVLLRQPILVIHVPDPTSSSATLW